MDRKLGNPHLTTINDSETINPHSTAKRSKEKRTSFNCHRSTNPFNTSPCNERVDMGIVFTLREQKYIVSMREIVEVIPLPARATSVTASNTRTLTTFPETNSWLAGVTNLRGRLLPLIDLAIFCGFSENKKVSKQSVLITEFDNIFCGIIVDSVKEFRQFVARDYKSGISKSLPKVLHCCMVGECDGGGIGNNMNHGEYLVLSFKALLKSHQLLNISPIIMTS